jgi:hypothetical protein
MYGILLGRSRMSAGWRRPARSMFEVSGIATDAAGFAEGVMAAEKNWSDVSPRTRQLIVTAAVVDGVLKTAALVDIKRRSADQIRGSKWMWAAAILLINSAGGLPVAYFAYGRRRAD